MAACVCGTPENKGHAYIFHDIFIAVQPVQQVGAMWTELAADEVHLFPTAVDETALHDMKITNIQGLLYIKRRGCGF